MSHPLDEAIADVLVEVILGLPGVVRQQRPGEGDGGSPQVQVLHPALTGQQLSVHAMWSVVLPGHRCLVCHRHCIYTSRQPFSLLCARTALHVLHLSSLNLAPPH